MKAEVLAVCCSGAFRCVLAKCQGGKKSAVILEKQLRKSPFPFPKSISNYLRFIILYSQLENIQDIVYLPRTEETEKFASRLDHAMVRDTAKTPRATAQNHQASVCMLNATVHDSTIRKRLKNFGRLAWKKPLLSQKNMAALFRMQICI